MLMCDAALSFGPLGAFPREAGEAGARHERRREACRGEAAAGAHLEPRRGACPEGEEEDARHGLRQAAFLGEEGEAGSRHEPLQGVFQEGEVAGAHHER